MDQLNAVVNEAVVTATDEQGHARETATDSEGRYLFTELPPGKYIVRVAAPGFAPYEQPQVEIASGRVTLNIKLNIVLKDESVTVEQERPVSVSPQEHPNTIVLRGTDLDSLPDDPEEMAAALQALAGPGAGPSGGAIFVDGFNATHLPSKNSIREVRINQNPFTAENDTLGFSRIEVFTKPGTQKFHGQGFFNFNRQNLNSRNPFAESRAPYRMLFFGGNLSGPIRSKKSSFFLDFDRRDIDDNAVINAVVLDPLSLSVTPLAEAVVTPQRRTSFSPRLDYQLSQRHTLVARYSYTRSTLEDAGIGNFTLLQSAYDAANTEHVLQLTETAVLNPKTINETRFQWLAARREQNGSNGAPAIRVLDAFTLDTQVGEVSDRAQRWELQNYLSRVEGRHTMRMGVRLRGVSIHNSSTQNFGGTFVFAGGIAPQLDANNHVVTDAGGVPLMIPITSIERYRRTLLFQSLNLTPAEIRALGGGATQFSITKGNPEAGVKQVDLGAFIQDDWLVRDNMMVGLGLRYETQNNISSKLNFAPRIFWAWGVGKKKQGQPKMVLRGGFGLFYDRVGENLIFEANRYNGQTLQQLITSDTSVLDLFPQSPPASSLSTIADAQAIRRIAPDLQSPYTIQFEAGFAHLLPHNFVFSATFLNARALHLLRSRNINAPLLLSQGAGQTPQLFYPFGNRTSIYQYESSGIFKQNQLYLTLQNRFSQRFTLLATYILNKADSDTDTPNSFPANSYDLRGEYGRSILDIRHRFYLSGTINAFWKLRFNPLLSAYSGRPFNIVTGRDFNGDTLYTDRPAFADDLTRPGVIVTPFGAFDPNPSAGQQIIPRNFGNGPGFFTFNLRVSRAFSFGPSTRSRAAATQGNRASAESGKAGPAAQGARAGGAQRAEAQKRYSLTLSVQMQNLFNRTNKAAPIGNLTSTLFGHSNASTGGFGFGALSSPAAGNRRIELQLRLAF